MLLFVLRSKQDHLLMVVELEMIHSMSVISRIIGDKIFDGR
jgi:hypothetical protein